MSEPSSPSGWDVAAIIGGVVTVLGMFGSGVAFLLGWADRRHVARLDRLARQEDELAESWSAFRKRIVIELIEAQTKIVDLERRDVVRAKESAALRVASELLAGSLRILDPGNIALIQAEQILATAFPLDPIIPTDMSRSLAAIHSIEVD